MVACSTDRKKQIITSLFCPNCKALMPKLYHTKNMLELLCANILFCELVFLNSFIIKMLESVIGGSCHKYHFCHDKSFVTTNMCLL